VTGTDRDAARTPLWFKIFAVIALVIVVVVVVLLVVGGHGPSLHSLVRTTAAGSIPASPAAPFLLPPPV
jgi:hypothetical protein